MRAPVPRTRQPTPTHWQHGAATTTTTTFLFGTRIATGWRRRRGCSGKVIGRMASGRRQVGKVLDDFLERVVALLLAARRTDIDAVAFLLLGTDTENVSKVCKFGVTNFALELLGIIEICLHHKAEATQFVCNVFGVVVKLWMHWNHNGLSRVDPEWPASSKIFSENRNHAFTRPENGAVNHDGADRFTFTRDKLELESFWQLKVELDGGALEGSLQGVANLNVNLGTVKGTISRVERPRLAKRVERPSQCGLCLVPRLLGAEGLLRFGRELELKGKPKRLVDRFEKRETTRHLRFNLFGHAENVSIVLLETTNAGEARQCSECFVSVQHTKVGNAVREFLVRPGPMLEEETVPGAIHGLEGKRLLLHLETKHVIVVVLPVSRRLPQL
eukprot:m.167860 g.167860  ORF g.167860 m.167860 type:complete len:388 (-) comp12888_c0_seq1:1202-2365(-)